jgi:radical SAM enzyme (TIGR01210 family)
LTSPYSASPAERSAWILTQRPERTALSSNRPYAFLVEEECSADGQVLPVATIFLTNRECPWRCLMCDLWKNTLTESVAPGEIPQQIEFALAHLPPARQVKLYNSGSFFDVHAIPVQDYPAVASQVQGLERIIVESHPALITERCLQFRDLLSSRLEVAMGLETVHTEILDRLNKRMTLEQYARAAEFLRANEIDLRVFILLQPPFMKSNESLYWAQRSLDYAFECGATAATLIPTRGGNGAMEILAESGNFTPPRLETLEMAARYGLGLRRGRVFVDLWDLRNKAGECPSCYPARIARLHAMNLQQQILAPVACTFCEGHS